MTKVRDLMKPGTRLKFRNGKVNRQSSKSARRENSPRSGKHYKVGTKIRFKK